MPALTPDDVERAIGYTFRDRDLLRAACVRESPEFAALEFIGDAYLNLAVCLACWHAGMEPDAAVRRFKNDNLRSRFASLFGRRRGTEKEDYLETTIGALSFEAGFEEIVQVALHLVDASLPVPPFADRDADALHESTQFRRARWLGEATLKCVAVDLLRELHGPRGRAARQLYEDLANLMHDLNNRLSPGWSSRWSGTAPPARRVLARRTAATLVEFGWETTRGLVRRELGFGPEHR
jgi:hypothetical protein